MEEEDDEEKEGGKWLKKKAVETEGKGGEKEVKTDVTNA